MLWAVAILTMVVGTITAVTQTDVKRMLAYSAVAHTGQHLLVGDEAPQAHRVDADAGRAARRRGRRRTTSFLVGSSPSRPSRGHALRP